MHTHYDTLEVKETASNEVIKGAYKYLSQKWHPDKNPGNREEAARKTAELNTAYGVLSDPGQRMSYDIDLALKRKDAACKHAPQTPSAKPYAPTPRDDFIDIDGRRIRLASIHSYNMEVEDEIQEYYVAEKEPEGFWENFCALSDMLQPRNDEEQQAFVEKRRAARRRTRVVKRYSVQVSTYDQGRITVTGKNKSEALIAKLDKLLKN